MTARLGTDFARTSPYDFAVSASSTADFVALFAALKADGFTPRRIVHAWDLGADEPPGGSANEDEAAFERRQQHGLVSLARCLGSFKGVFGREAASFDIVTAGVAEVTGDEPLRPGAASALAFARVAPQENVQIAARVLDIDPGLLAANGPRTFDRVAAALRSPLQDRVLALRGDFWWAQAFDSRQVSVDAAPLLKRGGVYLITGGMGYIGLIFARHLLAAWDARLVLVGRSPLAAPVGGGPTRAAHLAELEALGGEVIYIQADVSDLEDVRRIRVGAHERFGRLDGVIFGAGVVEAVGPVEKIDGSDILEQNYAGKVRGLKHVLDVFKDDALDFGIVLSSLSTVLGGLNLCAYSAANHIADAMVLAHRRAGHGEWLTTNWDLWGDGHFIEAARFSSLLALAIQPEEGCLVLEHILGLAGGSQIVVSTHDLAQRIAFWVTGSTSVAAPQVQHKRPSLATEYAEPEGELELKLHEVWSRLLGIASIGRDDDFFEMGGHSILAVRASVQIQEFLPPDVPAPNIYDAPTIRLLAAALGEPHKAALAA